jgi:hypothetical protein
MTKGAQAMHIDIPKPRTVVLGGYGLISLICLRLSRLCCRFGNLAVADHQASASGF